MHVQNLDYLTLLSSHMGYLTAHRVLFVGAAAVPMSSKVSLWSIRDGWIPGIRPSD